MNVLNETVSERFAMYQGDCVQTLEGLPENGVHYALFSPPFASLYTYSNSDRDMGNSRDDEEFQYHFEYLIAQLYRVTMPGRAGIRPLHGTCPADEISATASSV